jgi:hypothetical protein
LELLSVFNFILLLTDFDDLQLNSSCDLEVFEIEGTAYFITLAFFLRSKLLNSLFSSKYGAKILPSVSLISDLRV